MSTADDHDQSLVADPLAERVSNFLRSCAGVDEEILKSVWSDRHRYAGVGGIVLGTAVMAAASMTLAITLVTESFRAVYLIAPLLWGLFVFNLDRWLVTSTHGVGRRWALIPRALLAILFGIVIAEPVVLWVFADAIEESIADERSDDLSKLTTLVLECNPDDSVEAEAKRNDPTCIREGALVEVTLPAEDATLAQLEQDLETQDNRIDAQEQQLLDLEARYAREIQGDQGVGNTGTAGIGPVARDIAEKITAKQEEIADLQTARVGVEQRAEAARTSAGSTDAQFREAMATGRDDKLELLRDRAEKEPGLLQRFDALTELAEDHRHIWVARWLLTIFLVAVDTMPVLAKALSGKTPYDRVLDQRLRGAEQQERIREQAKRQDHLEQIDLTKYAKKEHRKAQRKKVTLASTRDVLDLDDELVEVFDKRGVQRDSEAWALNDQDAPVVVPPRPMADPRPTSERRRTLIRRRKPPAAPPIDPFDRVDAFDEDPVALRNEPGIPYVDDASPPPAGEPGDIAWVAQFASAQSED